jgi:hypothetical protein
MEYKGDKSEGTGRVRLEERASKDEDDDNRR